MVDRYAYERITSGGVAMTTSHEPVVVAKTMLADLSGLTQDDLFGGDMTLAELIERSDRMINSIDVMEAFARIANRMQTEFHVRIRLRPVPLDTTLASLVQEVCAQIHAQPPSLGD
jgi:hypothetical protein